MSEHKDETTMTRREALRAGGLAAGGALLTVACEPPSSAVPAGATHAPEPSPTNASEAVPSSGSRAEPTKAPSPGDEVDERLDRTTETMPAVFLPHGGGPWPFMDERIFGKPGMWDEMRTYMENLSMVPPTTPEAVLVVSAHWEEDVPTVQTSASPPMYYDYYGFPEETYEIEWPAPGAPEVAGRVRELLEGAGFTTDEDAARGFDHGTFVPLKLAWPTAGVPTLQLSLERGLDPSRHVQLGRALEPLRREGIFIVGSGMSYHNLRALMGRAANIDTKDDSRAFDEWLAETMELGVSQRETRLVEWERAPRARRCHPREEHLLPLMVVAGAAGEDAASVPYRDVVMGAHVSAVHFG